VVIASRATLSPREEALDLIGVRRVRRELQILLVFDLRLVVLALQHVDHTQAAMRGGVARVEIQGALESGEGILGAERAQGLLSTGGSFRRGGAIAGGLPRARFAQRRARFLRDG